MAVWKCQLIYMAPCFPVFMIFRLFTQMLREWPRLPHLSLPAPADEFKVNGKLADNCARVVLKILLFARIARSDVLAEIPEDPVPVLPK